MNEVAKYISALVLLSFFLIESVSKIDTMDPPLSCWECHENNKFDICRMPNLEKTNSIRDCEKLKVCASYYVKRINDNTMSTSKYE